MVVEIKQGFFVYQHVLFARFVFQRGDVFNQLFVVGKKGGLKPDFALKNTKDPCGSLLYILLVLAKYLSFSLLSDTS